MFRQSDLPPKEKKKSKWKRVLLWVLLFLLALILIVAIAGVITFHVMYQKGKTSLSNEVISVTAPEGVELENDGAQVYYNGEKYRFNRNIVTFLLMGTDKESIYEQEGAGYNGQADAIYLLAADTVTGEVDLITLSRDSMTDVSIYSAEGAFVRDEQMQLCLAYAYGDGRESSCENVKKAVSRLLYGVPINGYLAIDLSAIPVLNDAVGGVSVPEYAADKTTPTGKTITLWGKKAEEYLRVRNKDFVDSNNTRMDRQRAYINSFVAKAVEQTRNDISTPLNLYNSLKAYMVTDITADEVTYMAANYLDGVAGMQMHSVAGEVVKGEEYAEFIVDKAALYELILEVFYEKVE